MRALSGKMAELLDELRREYPNWLEVLADERRTTQALALRGLIEVRDGEARLLVRAGAAESKEEKE